MKNILLLIFLTLGVGLLPSCEKEDQIEMVNIDFHKKKGSAEVTVVEIDHTARTFVMSSNDSFDVPSVRLVSLKFKMLSDGVVRINKELIPLNKGETYMWKNSSSSRSN